MNRRFKQKNIPWLGALTDSVYISLPILSIANFLAISTILYASVFPYLQVHAPWMRYWTFMIILGVLTLILMMLVYKFVIPSLWTYRSKQMFIHESDITDKLNELIKKVEGLEKEKK